MTKPSKLLASLRTNPNQIIAFRDFERMLRSAGFVLKRQKGSHRSYRHPEVARVLTIQPNGKEAEPYQVDAFIAILNEHGLEFDSWWSPGTTSIFSGLIAAIAGSPMCLI